MKSQSMVYSAEVHFFALLIGHNLAYCLEPCDVPVTMQTMGVDRQGGKVKSDLKLSLQQHHLHELHFAHSSFHILVTGFLPGEDKF